MQLYFYNGQPTNYQISKKGEVYNLKTKNWLKGQISKNGYHTFLIVTSEGKKRLYCHRMVMETYSPRIDMKNLEVNHIDGNKTNNNFLNLEWLTSSENKYHAHTNGLYSSTKSIYGFNDKLEIVVQFNSIREASRILNCSESIISQSCHSNPKIKAKGYYWSLDKEASFKIFIPSTGTKKQVGKFSLEDEFLERYQSISDAARKNEINRTHIGECCNGKIKTYKGFIWKFI